MPFPSKTSLTSESACVPFLFLGLLELSASMLAVFIPLLAPSRSVSLRLLWLHGVGCVDFRHHRSNYVQFRNQLGYTVAKM